ncbi:hypothetical protein RSAG8_05300, partial [Rhizoctonia solani AG-8 WAC10335]
RRRNLFNGHFLFLIPCCTFIRPFNAYDGSTTGDHAIHEIT